MSDVIVATGVDLITEGEERKDEQGKNTIYVRRVHLVTPSGKVCCKCELDPKKVFIFWRVNVPEDFADLWCDESEATMRKEMDRLKGKSDG